MRTRIYIDGFNFYYGKLKGTPYKWLNPLHLCEALLPRHNIEYVRYFAAKVKPRPNEKQQSVNQQIYFRALKTISNLEIHLGHFSSYEVSMPDAQAWHSGFYQPRKVIKTEEKGSDVNLATWLLMDAFDNLYDCAIIISNDSDLREPVKLVRNRFGKIIGILSTTNNKYEALNENAHFVKPIRKGVLAASQFAPILRDDVGLFTKPLKW